MTYPKVAALWRLSLEYNKKPYFIWQRFTQYYRSMYNATSKTNVRSNWNEKKKIFFFLIKVEKGVCFATSRN